MSCISVRLRKAEYGNEQPSKIPKEPTCPFVMVACSMLSETAQFAHFYFEVTDYVQQKDNNGSSARFLLNQKVKFKTTYDKKDSDSFAHIGPLLEMAAPGEEESKAFQQFVLDDTVFKPGEWRTRSLGSAPLDVTYEVVFFSHCWRVLRVQWGVGPDFSGAAQCARSRYCGVRVRSR